MLLNSVILVLQETLEATLLISVLLTISHLHWQKHAWVIYALVGGLALSVLYARQMVNISEWFDYVGQEIVNALLQIIITLLICFSIWAFLKNRRMNFILKSSINNYYTRAFIYCAAITVALSIMREGSEIFLYLSGFFHQDEYIQSVMIGSLVGFGIGISMGVLLFYGLLFLPTKWRLRGPLILLALFAGNMLSQATLQLNQADWAPSTPMLWDSSAWIPENSIAGQLLYALIGYEATPSALQVFSYIFGVTLALIFAVVGNKPSDKDPELLQINPE